jgi:hypothetical protein
MPLPNFDIDTNQGINRNENANPERDAKESKANEPSIAGYVWILNVFNKALGRISYPTHYSDIMKKI